MPHADAAERRTRPIAVLLALATLLAYWPVVHCGYLNLDDDLYVTANPAIWGGLTFAGARWALTATHAGLWHPLTWLSHMLDVQLYGANPAGHHATNLLLHVANVVVLLLVLVRTTGALWPSAAVAALFALHPLRVESVAWVAERKDLLSGLFGLTTIWAYARYAERPDPGRYALVAVSLALGLMAKPMLVTLPLVLLLLDRWPLRRGTSLRLVVEKMPLLALAGAAGLMEMVAAQRAGAVGHLARFPLEARLANALVSYARYLGKTVWPSGLAVFYPYPSAWPAPQLAGAAVLLLAVTVLAIVQMRRRPYLLVGWLWFLGMLLPVSGVVQAGSQAMADRFTYLPQIGLFVMAAWGGRDLLARWPVPPPALAACAVTLLLALGGATWRQVGYWHDSTRLFTHALEVTSGNWLAHNNLGDALAREGKLEEATRQFTESVRLEPSNPDAHYNLGVVLHRQGHPAEAIAHYREAVRLAPDHPNAHSNLGVALLDVDEVEQAIGELQQAFLMHPDAGTHFNLGLALARQGRTDEAIEHYREAVRLQPDFGEARQHLADALASQAKTEEARGPASSARGAGR
jgi:tetratricopeptide (TPR) repeat protein